MKGKDGCTNCIKLYVNTQTMTLQCFVPWAARDAISLCLSDACQFGTLLAEHVCKHPSVAHWMVLAESKPWHGADKSRFGEKALPAVMAVGLASTTGSMWYSSTSWSDVLGILFPSSSWQISIVMGSLACLSSVCFLHCQATVVSCRGDLSTDNQGRLLASSAAIYANLTFMPVLAHACAFHPQLKLLLLINKLFFAVGTFQFRDSIRRAGGDLIKTRALSDRPRRTLSHFVWQEFEVCIETACAALLIDAPASANKAVLANACSRVSATFGVAWLFWWPRGFFEIPWFGAAELF